MQPADTLKPGRFHVGVGSNLSIPASRIVDAIDTSTTLADKYADDPNYSPSEQEQRDYTASLVGLILNAPGINSDFMVRYGLIDKLDAGLRWTSTGVHGDAKYQFLDHASGWQGAISLGVSHHFFDGTVFDVLEYLHIDDFSRNDIEVPLIFGKRFGSWGYLWGGPKYVFAKYSVDATIDNVAGLQSSDDSIHYYGAYSGFGLGYKSIYAFAELTVMNMVAKPVILGEKTDLGGIIVMPAFGLMARW